MAGKSLVGRISNTIRNIGSNAVDLVKSVGSGVTFVGSPGWSNVIHLDSGRDPEAERLHRSIAMATSAYAYTAIMYRASRVGEPPLIITEPTDDGDQEVDNHELSMVLKEPSLDLDMGELQQLTEIYRCVTGSCLWVRQDDVVGRTAGYVPFSGDEFETRSKNGRIYGEFIIKARHRDRELGPEDVVFFRDLNPNSWRVGLSKLDVALSQLDLGHQIERTVRNFMRKAMFPGGVISPHPEWRPDDDEWRAFETRVKAWHQGPANAGEPLIVEGGTKFSQSAIPLKELLPGEMLDRIEAINGSVFGIPPVVLGWLVGLKNSPWSQMSEARQMTYEDTIEPRWKDVGRKMTRQMLPREDRERGLEIVFDTSGIRAFQSDDLVQSEVVANMRREWTRNERRVYMGWDPLPDDDPRGDQIEDASMTGVPVPEEEDDLIEEEEEEEVVEEDEDPDDDEDEEDAIFEGLEIKDSRDLNWVIFDYSTKASERAWVSEIDGSLRRIRKKTLSIFKDTVRSKEGGGFDETKAADPDSILEFLFAFVNYMKGDGEEDIRNTSRPLVESTGKSAIRRLASSVGLTLALLQEGLDEYASEEADYLASVMGETTGRKVADTVQAELLEGGSIRSIRKALEADPIFDRTRAQKVARTETTRAWNGAQRRSLVKWKQKQPESTSVKKEWLSSRDTRVREEHDDLDDGTKYDISEPFPNGLQEPGEPNCRCTLIYSIDES